MIMARAGVILVELPMLVSQFLMISAVLAPTVEALLMGSLVGPAGVIVKLPVARMIPCVAVILIMRRRLGHWDGQHGCCRKQRSAEHVGTPCRVASASRRDSIAVSVNAVGKRCSSPV
jgi:hypothetical protein